MLIHFISIVLFCVIISFIYVFCLFIILFCFTVLFTWYITFISCFFFFFKQNPSYEMRISAWSSDVCSSDLHARNLPARIGNSVARNLHDGRDQFMVPDAAVIGSSDGAQFGAALIGLQELYLFAAVRQQAVLEIDAGERGGQAPQI